MASPDHIPEMDFFDRLTVILYRSGLSLFALSIALESIELLSNHGVLGAWYLPLVAASSGIANANIHLYDPRFRWFFPLTSWLGFIVLAFTLPVRSPELATWLSVFSLAFFYAAASMFALKEYFCFRVPGLPLMPILLGGALLLRCSGFSAGEGFLLTVAAFLYIWMAWAKWKMPLHFDIGDKSMYKI
jgi:uncharacterized integral membrane protein